MKTDMPRIEFDGRELVATNRFLERRWRVTDRGVVAVSIRSADGREWLTPSEEASIVSPSGSFALQSVEWQAQGRPVSPVRAEALDGTLTVRGASGQSFKLHLTVFHDCPAVMCQLELVSPGEVVQAKKLEADSVPTGVEQDRPGLGDRESASDIMERWVLALPHASLIQVELMDRTDVHDNLTHERSYRLTTIERIRLRTCLAAIEDPFTGDGLILLKHAPLPHARPVQAPHDLQANGREIELMGHGTGDQQLGYAWSMLHYQGGRWGRARALHSLQRCLRVPRPGRDGVLLSNTWGDRNRDARINEPFVSAEIDAGAELGVEVCQIDDGWEQGITSNSVEAARGGVWEGFFAADENFWQPHPQRFPHGLGRTSDRAKQRGLGLGLWFAPDSAEEFANWQKDAQACLELWRSYGVAFIKLDGIKARTKLGELNLRRFFDAVLNESGGDIIFDLDITAEVRPGYFGAMDVGQLFVENRYTDWVRWWPHATLRNIWSLSWYVAPQRLRMEFLNPLRNTEKYNEDPLAPERWSLESLFATVMVSAPLAWFEVSNLPKQVAEAWKPLIGQWQRFREELHGGTILPIGHEPDGASFSGFISESGDVCHVLVFRQLTANADCELPLPIGDGWKVEQALGGRGEAVLRGSVLRVSLPHPLHFLWLRLVKAK